jgi:hypothetical protein
MVAKQQPQQGEKTKGTQNGGPKEKMNNKMEEAAKQPVIMGSQFDVNSLLEEGQQQQQPMKKPAEWSIDLTSICGDGNDQNALKLQKPKVIQIIAFCDNLNFNME